MEYIYILDNIDCFSNMNRDVVIDGENVPILDIPTTDKDSKYNFVYSLPSDYHKNTIRVLTCCGLINTVNVMDLDNKEYIDSIQKSAIDIYKDRKDEHTEFTDFLYSILIQSPKVITVNNIDSINQKDDNTIDMDLVEGD